VPLSERTVETVNAGLEIDRGILAAHVRFDPAGMHEQYCATFLLVSLIEAASQHIQGRFARAVDLPASVVDIDTSVILPMRDVIMAIVPHGLRRSKNVSAKQIGL